MEFFLLFGNLKETKPKKGGEKKNMNTLKKSDGYKTNFQKATIMELLVAAHTGQLDKFLGGIEQARKNRASADLVDPAEAPAA